MSYFGGKHGLGPRGSSLGALGSILDTASGALDAAKFILEDPSLPQITYSVVELHSLEQRGVKPGGPSKPGVGLSRLVKPLKTYVQIRRNPALGYLAIAGVIAIPVMVGYALGRRRR